MLVQEIVADCMTTSKEIGDIMQDKSKVVAFVTVSFILERMLKELVEDARDCRVSDLLKSLIEDCDDCRAPLGRLSAAMMATASDDDDFLEALDRVKSTEV